MENQDNNNLNELEQLKAQYETLKQQFDQQEILNDRLMKSSIKRNVDFYMRYRWKQYILYPVGVLAGLLVIKWEFDNNLSLRLFWIVYLVVSFAFEIWMLKKLHVKTLENNDLLTLSNQARSFKKFFSIFTIISAVPMLVLVVGFLLSKLGHRMDFVSFLLSFCATLVFFVSVGIAEIRHKTKPCNEIIQQIEASEATENKKTDFDRKQKWFFIVMMVAFLCLDVWAYMIVASCIKLPPMWRTVEYVRADNDISTEGKLAIWEVFADTLVAEEDVAVVMEKWHGDDSLVVMRGKFQPTEIGMDEQSVHSWKHDPDHVETVHAPSLLYALKKTTPEGPAISSAILGGKPMVKKIVVTKPYKYPSNGSVPMIVVLTPEARQLWSEFTRQLTGKRGAVTIDGVVVQECLENGFFIIMREWSSKEELDAFCEQLIRQ